MCAAAVMPAGTGRLYLIGWSRGAAPSQPPPLSSRLMSGQLSVRLGLRLASGEAGCMAGGDSLVNSVETTCNAPATASVACWPACFVSLIESKTELAHRAQCKDPCETKEALESEQKTISHTALDYEICCESMVNPCESVHIQDVCSGERAFQEPGVWLRKTTCAVAGGAGGAEYARCCGFGRSGETTNTPQNSAGSPSESSPFSLGTRASQACTCKSRHETDATRSYTILSLTGDPEQAAQVKPAKFQ